MWQECYKETSEWLKSEINLVELEDMQSSQTVTCRELKEIASYIQWLQEKRLLMHFLNRNCVKTSLVQLESITHFAKVFTHGSGVESICVVVCTD